MPLSRRDLLSGALVAAVAALSSCVRRSPMPPVAGTPLPPPPSPVPMYGLIGKMNAAPGQRDALVAILLEGTQRMPGCMSYVIAKDAQDPDGLWITEVWESQAHHQASLELPAVQAAIARGRPLIAGFGHRVETTPIGGQGLRAG